MVSCAGALTHDRPPATPRDQLRSLSTLFPSPHVAIPKCAFLCVDDDVCDLRHRKR